MYMFIHLFLNPYAPFPHFNFFLSTFRVCYKVKRGEFLFAIITKMVQIVLKIFGFYFVTFVSVEIYIC